MKSVVQPVSGGPVKVLDVPRPSLASTEVLVRTIASVISPGTARAITALAQSSMLAKARARPDLVRQVMRKARSEGLAATAQAVRGRLAEDLPLGYLAAGQVVEVGPAVGGLRVGQVVATGGAGKAKHAEFQAVPGLLCAAVPGGVPAADAAFTTVVSIALHGLRQAEVGPGAKVVVVGLGLVGQLAGRLAMAAGCDVAGVDPSNHARIVAAQSGILALDELGDPTTHRVLAWSRGRGADAVLVCAASSSSAPVTRAPALCRDRAAIVIVGDVGLNLDRTPVYERELSLRFARSYGPGRHDPSYESWGVDYPAGQVRWTEGRNFEAALDLLAAGRLRVADLVTHRFDIGDAPAAYELMEKRPEPYLAVQLTYPQAPAEDAPGRDPAVRLVRQLACRRLGIGCGAVGRLAAGRRLDRCRGVLNRDAAARVPPRGLRAPRRGDLVERDHGPPGRGAVPLREGGLRGFPCRRRPRRRGRGDRHPHDTHAELAKLALRDGRHVWCEKPLALTMDELGEIEAASEASERHLMIAFNRSWSPAVKVAQTMLAELTEPKFLVYRIAAGPVPDGHWYTDRRQGGRVLGEVCHFIDTAQALIGTDIEETVSLLADQGHGRRSGDGRIVPGNEAVVSLRFADGSLATICYGSALPSAGKEWIQVTSGSRRLVINDFRLAKMDGKALWRGRQDKGRRACAYAFRRAIAGSAGLPTRTMLATTHATIQAIDKA